MPCPNRNFYCTGGCLMNICMYIEMTAKYKIFYRFRYKNRENSTSDAFKHERYVPVIKLIGSGVQRTVVRLFHGIWIFLLLFFSILVNVQFSARYTLVLRTILHLVLDFGLCQYDQKPFTFTCLWCFKTIINPPLTLI